MHLRVMTFNVWCGGRRVEGGPAKIVEAVKAAGADIVGFQETEGSLATGLAHALGWSVLQGPSSVAIASRFPITEIFGMAHNQSAVGARLRVRPEPAADVVVWCVHLGHTHYGPYAVRDLQPQAALYGGERDSGRIAEIRDILRRVDGPLADRDRVPVLLLGDFNAPSHLDWGGATAPLHHGVAYRWPVSRYVERRGFRDAYRSVHPDPGSKSGTTWSPLYPAPAEPQDRIDFIYLAGAGRAVGAEVFVVGKPAVHPSHQGNSWPSDHAAVFADLDLTGAGSVGDRRPSLALDRAVYAPGERWVVRVRNNARNPDDWVGIFRAGDPAVRDAAVVWCFLNGARGAPRRGRRRADLHLWARVDAGEYGAHLFYGNGGGVVASTEFSVAAG